MKTGDVFYTFDYNQRTVKKMLVIEVKEYGVVFGVEISGTTSFPAYTVPQPGQFKTPEEALEGLKNEIERTMQKEKKRADIYFNEMYKNEVKK